MYRIVCLILCLCTIFTFAHKRLDVEGFFSDQHVTSYVEEVEKSEHEPLFLVVNANGGDFFATLRFCQALAKKKASGDEIVVLIAKRAIGPPALIPFMATSVYVLPGSVWGNIPYGLSGSIPIDVIGDAVKGLIPEGGDDKQLEQIAEAMVDPYTQVSGIPYTNDPLLLSTPQIVALKFGTEIPTKEAFYKKFQINQLLETKTGIGLHQVRSIMTEEALNASFKNHVRFHTRQENYVGYIRVETPFTRASYLHARSAIAYFKKQNIKLLALDIDVKKGDVFAAIQMVQLLQKLDVDSGIPVLALLHDDALGAGALIALGCRYIISMNNSSFGSSDPIRYNKLYAALQDEFGKTATFWDRSKILAEAMVNKDYTIVLRNHQIHAVKKPSEITTNGADPDVVLTTKGEFFTAHGKDIYNYGLSNAEIVHASLVGDEEYQSGSWSIGESFLSELSFFKDMSNVTVLRSLGWGGYLLSICTHPAFLACLFFGLFVGFYLELNTPGFGLFGAIGLFCFALLLFGAVTSNDISGALWLSLGIGLLLFAIELFLIPGFGWTGILGISVILGSLALFFVPNTGAIDVFTWDGFALVFGYVFPLFLWIASGLALGGILVYVLARYFSHRFLNLSHLNLRGSSTYAEGYTLHDTEVDMPEIGSLGEAVTGLKPSGKVRIGDELFEAVTQTGFIDAGMPVTLVRIDGYKLVVRILEEGE